MEIFYLHLFSFLIIFSCFCFNVCTSTDTITSSQFIKDPQTINSNDSLFTLGFFSPENSTNRYVGIWYKKDSPILWVANRNQPLKDSSGIVTISEDGNLVILTGKGQTIWSSNVSNITSNTTCLLSNSGNLELLDNNTGIVIWHSFEHPSNTLLPSMKLAINKRTGEKQKLTSWKSLSDPSIGKFSLSLEHPNMPELFLWDETGPNWRSGPWNGQSFSGVFGIISFYLQGFSVAGDMDEVSLNFTLHAESNFTIYVLDSYGNLQNLVGHDNRWISSQNLIVSNCDRYGVCGAFGSCNINYSPPCNCLKGFEPFNAEEWSSYHWTNGCVRKTTLQCERMKNGSADGKEDGFQKLTMVKVPDFAEWSLVSEDTCRNQCLDNCSCVAYSYESNSGCMSWSGNLIDIQELSSGGFDLHIRLAYSDLEEATDNRTNINVEKERDRKIIIIITITIIIGTIIIVFGVYLFWKWIAECSEKASDNTTGELSRVQLQELLTYDFEKVAIATNNFDMSNKLGQGGFGPVYKGTLQDGQYIAVKRLSRASRQGLEEFMNEVVIISKLQHRNLVRLLGCCIEGEEKMLIYEYMLNKSLDAFIFDPPTHKSLDWQKRFEIIEGVARGILYLHRDSRLKIIHRDLKATNILLDENLTPKISDFGMARIFESNEDQANTRRIVGTYGYMSPEYAIEGRFSEKSDVFSFGVLLLEIISGRRNSSFYNDEHALSLLGFAWKLWNEKKVVSLIDQRIYGPDLEKDIVRCIHIGLLCVQDLERGRPVMGKVISMLTSEIVNLPSPRQPAFIQMHGMTSSVSHEETERLVSINAVSITDLDGR